MSARARTAWILAGTTTAAALVVAAIVWGMQGVEAASWIAGIASFFAALVTTVQSRTGDRSELAQSSTTHRTKRRGTVERVQLNVHAGPAGPADPKGPGPGPLGPVGTGQVDGMIVRDAELDRVVALLTSGERGLCTVLGGHGMGKSTFLRQLRERVSRTLPDVVLLPVRNDLSAEPYGLSGAYTGEYGDATNAATAALLVEKSTQLLAEIVDGLPHHFAAFGRAIEESRAAAGQAVTVHSTFQATGSRSSVSDARIDLTIADTEASVLARYRAAQRLVDDAFVDDWRGWLGERRALLILDGFESLIDDVVGQWFLGLVSRLRGALVVVPMVPDEYARHAQVAQDARRSVQLPFFTAAQTHSYLTGRLGAEPPAELTTAVHDHTNGHPFGVGLVAAVLQEHGGCAADPAQLRRLLGDLSTTDGQLRPAELVRAVVVPQRRPQLWRTVEIAALVNVFDAELLRHLISVDSPGNTDDDTGALISQLSQFGLLDQVSAGGRYRIHDFIRPTLADRIARQEPERWRRIHHAAAAHYFALIADFDDRVDKTYSSWYKYEDPLWQSYETEWLHHSAQLPRSRSLTRCQFLVLFFEAFWWWGVYVDFPFCHQLLESWSRAADDDVDRELLDELRRFQRNYPPGPDKPAGSHWLEAQRALRAIRDLCSLRTGTSTNKTGDDGAPVRHRALLFIRLFTAHALRYNGDLIRAEAAYRELEQDLIALDEQLMLAWDYYEWADLAIDAADRPAAVTRCQQAVQAAQAIAAEDEIDSELVANLHRCLGDIIWVDDPVAAADQYGHAVLHAFLFQRMDTAVSEYVHPPDEYTSRFYQEMTVRAAERALVVPAGVDRTEVLGALLRATGGRVTAQALDVVTAADADPVQVAGQLFPRGPSTAELHRRTSAFMDYYGDLVDGWDVPDSVAALAAISDVADRLAATTRADVPD